MSQLKDPIFYIQYWPTNNQIHSSLLYSSFILISVLIGLKLKKRYSFFTDRNLNGPRPWPFIGHLHKFIWKDIATESSKMAQQFGLVYGIYLGLEPRLVVADRELAQQICIKDFDVFTDHHGFELITEYQKNFLFSQKGDVWRRNRVFISPTFTSGKIRKMYKLLEICAQDLIELFREQFNTSKCVDSNGKNVPSPTIVDAKDIFYMYSLDAIARCCYGLDLERARGKYDANDQSARTELVLICKRMFHISLLRILPELVFPIKLVESLGHTVTPLSAIEPIAKIVAKMLQNRKEASSKNQKFDDYLQSLVDARIDDKLELDELDLVENHHANLTHESLHQDQQKLAEKLNSLEKNKQKDGENLIRSQMTDMEVISNAIFLLFVGLETSASLLSSCIYCLAFHPEIQDKLYAEVSKIADLDKNGDVKFDYDKLTKCAYLDAVISETLRYLPVAPMVDRRANRSYFIEKYNFTIPKDSVLFITINGIHHNPDYWPEPHKFNPERFMPGNREKILPGSYFPFGQGPRHCVGMRFSLTESKLALARVIMEFKFDSVPGLVFPGARPIGFTPGGLNDPRVMLLKR